MEEASSLYWGGKPIKAAKTDYTTSRELGIICPFLSIETGEAITKVTQIVIETGEAITRATQTGKKTTEVVEELSLMQCLQLVFFKLLAQLKNSVVSNRV